MAMPAAGETFTPRDLVMKLGAFLAELTSGRSAAEVHAKIAEQLSEPDHDPRLAGAADADRFAAMSAALGSDSSLPEEAWQGVVLPTVVAFSGPNDLKANLELATALWMAANAAIHGPSQTLTTAAEPEPEPEFVDSAAFPAARDFDRLPSMRSVMDVVDDPAAPPSTPRRRRPVIVAAVAAALIVVALVWWLQVHRATDDNRLSPPPPLPAGDTGQPASAAPSASAQAAPGAAPVGNTVPPPPSTQPVPAPTWNGPGPIVAPTAPRSLAATGTTETSVTLSWQPPADAGTGGLAYYRIWRDGTDVGWTPQSSATVPGLTPATSYTFTVTAHNGAAAASPPSNPVTATTQPSQPQGQQPSPPQTGPPQTGPPRSNPLLATDPPQRPINLGRSFTVTGSGWPCTASATINLYLGGKLVATPGVNAQGGFRTTIAVDASQPNAPTVAVIGSSERLTLTRGVWVLAAQLPEQPSCTAAADQSIQIEFRSGPG